MSEYTFGVTYQRPARSVARRMNRIVREEAHSNSAWFVEVNVRPGTALGINGGRYQGWFVAPNRGEPFDSNLARRVLERVERVK